MSRLLALLLVLAAACTERDPGGSDSDTSTSSSSSTSATTTTSATDTPTTGSTSATTEDSSTGAPAECLEVTYEAPQAPPPWMLTCGLPALCPGETPWFLIGSADVADPKTVEVDDLEQARCLVAALRDRTAGQIAWDVVSGVEVIQSVWIEILGDTVIARSIVPLWDPGPDNAWEALQALHAPEFFAGCAGGDAMQVFTCLNNSLTACLPGPITCPE